jgi:hypothetical protein
MKRMRVDAKRSHPWNEAQHRGMCGDTILLETTLLDIDFHF